MEIGEAGRATVSAPSYLITRFSAIGDCVMAAHAATAIRLKHPEARIVWAVESRCADVIDTEHLVDEVVQLPRHKWKKGKLNPSNWREQLGIYRYLRRQKFDIGIDLQGHGKTAILMAMARPRRKISTAATDLFSKLVLPVAPGFDPKVHTVERHMQVIRTLEEFETPEAPIMPEVCGFGKKLLCDLGSPRSLVTIAASAGQLDKAYPIDRWDEVARVLRQDGHTVLFVGGGEDPHPTVEGVVDRIGKWNLRETAGALTASRLVLCGDTGAGHLAAAYRRPVLSVFGPTDPARFRPFSKTGIVIRNGRATENTCAEEVIEKAREVLRDAPIPD